MTHAILLLSQSAPRGELPVSSDEEEEDKHAKIDASQADGGSKICRKGTGFVHAGELPGSDDEEEEPSHHVQIQDLPVAGLG